MKAINFLFILSTLFMLTNCDSKENLVHLKTVTHADSHVKLEVYYVEAMSFGPSIVKIYAADGDTEKLSFTNKIYNDGSVLRKSNVGINWNGGDKVLVTLKGKEQDDKEFSFELE